MNSHHGECHHQIEDVVDRNGLTAHEGVMHPLTLCGCKLPTLSSVPAVVTYEDTVGALKHHYRKHQQVMAYQSQLKAKSHLSCVSLQELAVDTEQLAYRVPVELPKDFHPKLMHSSMV
jgi:hypothetical protein